MLLTLTLTFRQRWQRWRSLINVCEQTTRVCVNILYHLWYCYIFLFDFYRLLEIASFSTNGQPPHIIYDVLGAYNTITTAITRNFSKIFYIIIFYLSTRLITYMRVCIVFAVKHFTPKCLDISKKALSGRKIVFYNLYSNNT